jgi:hypothetical protein
MGGTQSVVSSVAICRQLLTSIKQTEYAIAGQQAQFAFLQLRYTLRCEQRMPHTDQFFCEVLQDVHAGKSLETIARAKGQDAATFLYKANARLLTVGQRRMFQDALRAVASNYDVDFTHTYVPLTSAQKIGLLTVALVVLLVALGMDALRRSKGGSGSGGGFGGGGCHRHHHRRHAALWAPARHPVAGAGDERRQRGWCGQRRWCGWCGQRLAPARRV